MIWERLIPFRAMCTSNFLKQIRYWSTSISFHISIWQIHLPILDCTSHVHRKLDAEHLETENPYSTNHHFSFIFPCQFLHIPAVSHPEDVCPSPCVTGWSPPQQLTTAVWTPASAMVPWLRYQIWWNTGQVVYVFLLNIAVDDVWLM